MKYDLGFFDLELGTVTSAENPFGAKVFCLCARTGPETRLPVGRELNPRHADFQSFFGGLRGLTINHLQRLTDPSQTHQGTILAHPI
jgi:hypothetical protein